MTTLRDLRPCEYASRMGSTTQKEWDKSKDDAMWLVGRAHVRGSLSRKDYISLVLKTIAPMLPSMSASPLECINELKRWVDGEGVDLDSIRVESEVDDLDIPSRVAYDTVDAAKAYALADATYAAYDAVDHEGLDIRLHISCEEICKYLGIDKDEILD